MASNDMVIYLFILTNLTKCLNDDCWTVLKMIVWQIYFKVQYVPNVWKLRNFRCYALSVKAFTVESFTSMIKYLNEDLQYVCQLWFEVQPKQVHKSSTNILVCLKLRHKDHLFAFTENEENHSVHIWEA